MKTKRDVAVTVTMRSGEEDFRAAEPLLLIHLNQKLDYVGRGIAMAFTAVEVGMLRRLILDRAEILGVTPT